MYKGIPKKLNIIKEKRTMSELVVLVNGYKDKTKTVGYKWPSFSNRFISYDTTQFKNIIDAENWIKSI
jgi:hypothetical protein